MANAFFELPLATNEPVLSYAPGSPERKELKAAIRSLKRQKPHIPMTIGGKKVTTKKKIDIRPPHNIKATLGTHSKATKRHVEQAIAAAMEAKESWANMPWQERAAIFLRAADLISGPYRARMNAATMLAQSKNAYQSEIDAVAELCDFFRFNVQYMADIYAQQPESSPGVWNRMEYRPLEGFVFALTPFNFTSIAGNLPGAPALLGNTVVWNQIMSTSLLFHDSRAVPYACLTHNLIFCL